MSCIHGLYINYIIDIRCEAYHYCVILTLTFSCSCRKIMERCTATNHLILLVARDHQSRFAQIDNFHLWTNLNLVMCLIDCREDFHRLSVSLGNVIDPSAMYRIGKPHTMGRSRDFREGFPYHSSGVLISQLSLMVTIH